MVNVDLRDFLTAGKNEHAARRALEREISGWWSWCNFSEKVSKGGLYLQPDRWEEEFVWCEKERNSSNKGSEKSESRKHRTSV
jgi:hypothetical protein